MTGRAAGIILGVLAATAAIILIAGTAGGGGGGGPLDPVAQAADTTTAAGSAEVGIAGSITAAGQTIPLNGSARIDMKHLKARMSFAMTAPGLGQTTFNEIMNGTVFYVQMPAALASRLPGGKQWIKVDMSQFKQNGVDFGKLMQANRGDANPADLLRYLKAVGTSQVVGHEDIRGMPTTHYRANIDVGKAAARIGDKQTADALRQMYASAGVQTIPVDVWIGRDGLVRRETIDLSMNTAAGAVAVNMTVEFIRFGISVDASPPPGDQVLDLGSMLRGALFSGSSG